MTTIFELITEIRHLYPEDKLSLIELEIILGKVLNLTRAQLKAWPEKKIDITQVKQIKAYCDRRIKGEPIAYLFSEREFWSLNFYVDNNVLIPRHETEHLIEYCVNQYSKHSTINCLDLGTGSGTIALALATEFPSWHICATDYSLAALDIAKLNAKQNKINNVQFIRMNWLQAMQKKSFDLIISNPPYIAESDPYLQQGDLPYEPQNALVAADDGLADLYSIIEQSKAALKERGELILEHGQTQGKAIREYMLAQGYTSVKTFYDYNQLERFTVGKYCHGAEHVLSSDS